MQAEQAGVRRRVTPADILNGVPGYGMSEVSELLQEDKGSRRPSTKF
jgi:hypothetical protein